MEQWLLRLPRSLLGLLVVGAILIYFIVSDPPQSACDAQMASVQEYLDRYVSRAKEDGWSYKSGFRDKYRACLKANSLGGCLVLIKRFKKFERQMRKVPKECSSHRLVAAKQKNYAMAIQLMAQLAWGAEPPSSLFEKKGWLDDESLALYCRLKKEHQRFYGSTAFRSLQESSLSGLPGAKELTRKQRWDRSLYSLPCKPYLSFSQ